MAGVGHERAGKGDVELDVRPSYFAALGSSGSIAPGSREKGQEIGALLLVAHGRHTHIRAGDDAFRVGNISVECRGFPGEAGGSLLLHGIRILETWNGRRRPADDLVETGTLQLRLLIRIDRMTRKAALEDALAANCVAPIGEPGIARQQDAEHRHERYSDAGGRMAHIAPQFVFNG